MEHITKFEQGTLKFIVVGEKGAVAFQCSPFSDNKMDEIIYHSNKIMYRGQIVGECDVLPSGACYCDGRFEGNDNIFIKRLKAGMEIWDLLEEEYRIQFGDKR